MIIDHVGIVVSDIEKEKKRHIECYGHTLIKDTLIDPLQHVKLCLLESENHYHIELIQPIDDTSPSYDFMIKGGGMHHFCYQTSDIEATISTLSQNGCLLIKKPTPAILFDNRKVAFLFDKKQRQVIELVESE